MRQPLFFYVFGQASRNNTEAAATGAACSRVHEIFFQKIMG